VPDHDGNGDELRLPIGVLLLLRRLLLLFRPMLQGHHEFDQLQLLLLLPVRLLPFRLYLLQVHNEHRVLFLPLRLFRPQLFRHLLQIHHHNHFSNGKHNVFVPTT
jgi:hypothetical protein